MRTSTISRINSTRIHKLLPFLDQAIVSACNFAIGIILVRTYGVQDYGTYLLLLASLQFVQSIQGAILIAPLQTLIPSLPHSEQSIFLNATSRLIVAFALLSAITSIALLEGYLFLTNSGHQGSLSAAFGIWMFSSLIQDGMRRSDLCNGNTVGAFRSDLIAYIGQTAAIIFVGGQSSLIEHLLIAISVVNIASALSSTFIRSSFLHTSGSTLWKVAKHSIDTGKWMLATSLMQWLSGNTILVATALVLGREISGSIKSAQNLIGVSHVVFQALENTIPRRAAAIFHAHGHGALFTYTKRLSAPLIAFTFILGATLVAFGPLIMEVVYGTRNQVSEIAISWYAAIYLLIAITLPFKAALRACKSDRAVFIGQACSSIFSVAYVGFSSMKNGVTEVMLAILVSYLINLLPQIASLTLIRRQVKHGRN